MIKKPNQSIDFEYQTAREDYEDAAEQEVMYCRQAVSLAS